MVAGAASGRNCRGGSRALCSRHLGRRLLLFMALAALMVLSLPLGWWLITTGRRLSRGTLLTTALALGVYVPALAGAPLLEQPRAKSRLLPVAGGLLIAVGLALRLLAVLEFRRQGASLAPKGWVPPRLVLPLAGPVHPSADRAALPGRGVVPGLLGRALAARTSLRRGVPRVPAENRDVRAAHRQAKTRSQ